MIGKAPKVVSTVGCLTLSTPHDVWTAEKVGWRIYHNGKWVMNAATKEKAKAYIQELAKMNPTAIVTMDTAEEYPAHIQ